MLGSAILDVAIGIVFVYLWVSLICSSVREGIESFMKMRAVYLARGIHELLADPAGQGWAHRLFEHPLIAALYSGKYSAQAERRFWFLARGKNLPSYIPARSFALALLDIAASDDRAAKLLASIGAERADSERAVAAIEAWYDSAMDRVSGWYKRSTQRIIFAIALVVCIAGNFNTIRIADHLYRDEAARAALVERSKVAVADPDYLKRSEGASQAQLKELHLPIGWGTGDGDWKDELGNPVAAIVGWLMTAFAATLGAPFWFDVLRKVMVIRATVKPSDEGSPSRSPAAPAAAPAAVAVAVPAASPAPAIDAEALASALAVLVARGAQNDVDSCREHAPGSYEETLDEDLPPATGGVALS
ncbi:MAG TPA: hypothetical protein VMG12_42005 [Polyangiaceae bacterium]|nr:hypothetical protein [Polyangiaceae bacterium]